MTEKPTGQSEHLEHSQILDIRDPLKWQLKIRLYLESLDSEEGERWMQGARLITTMAGRVVRDAMNRRLTTRCSICKGPLKDGKPAGNASYLDADRERINVYCCDQSEFGDLMKLVMRKENEIRNDEEKAEKAARQALVDARRAHNGKEARG